VEHGAGGVLVDRGDLVLAVLGVVVLARRRPVGIARQQDLARLRVVWAVDVVADDVRLDAGVPGDLGHRRRDAADVDGVHRADDAGRGSGRVAVEQQRDEERRAGYATRVDGLRGDLVTLVGHAADV